MNARRAGVCFVFKSFGAAAILSVVAAQAALAQAPTGAPAAAPPASAFGRLPAVQDTAMSPGGDKLAILGGPPESRSVRFATIDQPGEARLALGDVPTMEVRWAGDKHLLVRVAYWKTVGPRNAYRFERNVVVDSEGKVVSTLLEGDEASSYALSQPVVGVVAGDKPKAFVLGLVEAVDNGSGNLNTRLVRKEVANPQMWSLWRVDVAKGNGVIAERGTPDTKSWSIDATGEARVRVDRDLFSHKTKIYARAKGEKQWRPLPGVEPEATYMGYSDVEDAAFMARRAPGGVQQLVRIRLADGVVEPVGKPVTNLDIGLMWDEHLTKPAAIVSGGERPTYEWLDAQLGQVHAALSRAFKGRDVRLSGWSKDRTRYIVRVTAPDLPATWYLYDRARKELSPVGEEYPELKDKALGQSRWLTYKARDGLEIPAYLTLPAGAAADSGKHPLIVLPHGGPAARDTFDFDWWAQFLATRGYAVLQPQFRGSAGFGDDFEAAGALEWGAKVQTDLLDGVARLAADGVVDPARVCIVGASFGGYSALAGATLHPEAYRCAISVNGVSDLPQMLSETVTAYGNESESFRYWRRQMGNTYTDPTALTSVSPARQVTKDTPPVLLIWGERDTTVAPAQSERMRAAMAAARRPVESVMLEKDDHYLSSSASRTRMLEATEQFLAKHLPTTR